MGTGAAYEAGLLLTLSLLRIPKLALIPPSEDLKQRKEISRLKVLGRELVLDLTVYLLFRVMGF